MYSEDGLFIFALPRGATDVKLVSRTAPAADARPWLPDQRRLGVSVRQIVVRGAAEVIEVPLHSLEPATGWWELEASAVTPHRWTDGAAALRLPKVKGRIALLEVQLAGTMTYVINEAMADEARSEAA